MIPLYSKETADYAIKRLSDYPPENVQPEEIKAIIRLIENGNEAMGLLEDIPDLIGGNGFDRLAILLLIKKIKGEQ